jgi:DNA-binding NarL/FixJ family response regulator
VEATLSARKVLRVLIVDDHPVFLAGLRTTLELLPGMEVVGEARSGQAAVAAARQLRPDLILMDIDLPGITGLDATHAITSELPGTPVLMLTMLADVDSVFAAMRAGASGYVLKGASTEDIAQAVGAVSRGNAVFGGEVASSVFDYLTEPPKRGELFPNLTIRERAVLELVADGRGNSAIAHELGLSLKTVRNYLSRIFAKLQVADRAEAAVVARRAGLGH